MFKWLSEKKVRIQCARVAYATTVFSLAFFGTIGVIHAQVNNTDQIHRYVGDETCEICHSSERIGLQFQIWKNSPHALAFKDLASPKAQSLALKMGISNPQKSERCLSCHTTAPKAGLMEITSSFRKSDGVQCESCHGPGEDYSRYSTMMNPHKAAQAGLLSSPGEKTCITCHNPSSPTYQPFDYKRDVQKILHPIPAGFNRSKSTKIQDQQ
jgi:nitrate/TMAO reductase-like tetraheme cytochrome c subunit